MVTLLLDRIDSDLGQILIVADGKQLCAVDFADSETRMIKLLRQRYGSFTLRSTPNPQGFSDRLRAYLGGDYRCLDNIPVKTGGTQFQQQVWSALRKIPVGTTVSYQDLAIQIGQEKACRAVGLANLRNPVSIVLPCHRVVGKNKSLTGYAGGLKRKSWLLSHEGALPESALFQA